VSTHALCMYTDVHAETVGSPELGKPAGKSLEDKMVLDSPFSFQLGQSISERYLTIPAYLGLTETQKRNPKLEILGTRAVY
jgi:hypothetical protein